MAGRLAIAVAIAIACLLAQTRAFSGGQRQRRQGAGGANWVWEDDARERPLPENRAAPARSDAALLSHFSSVLSSVCCHAGRTFDVRSKTCRSTSAPQVDPLSGRSGLTALPPNCPPPAKYDPETKRCREVFD